MMLVSDSCLCGSNKSYQDCCSEFHQGRDFPSTAEALMRSRYSAYALGHLKYIQDTMCGKAAQGFDLTEAEQRKAATEWLGLDVIRSYSDKKNPARAFVEFRALYKSQGKIGILHELSEFTQIDKRWFYCDGKTQKSSRNDPCPCGGAKKYKHCHGGNC